MGNEQKNAAVGNTKVRDNGAKLIFDDPVLCAEFLRGYVDIDLLNFENLSENTPEYLLRVISKIITVFLAKLNIPKEEIGEFTGKIERREFTMLFDSFEAYDVQETRRVSRAEGKAEGKAEGEKYHLVKQICRKMKKDMAAEEIAELFEEDVDEVQRIYDIALRYAPDFDVDRITEEVLR